MVTFGRGALCKDAELHYYDYLCNPHDSTIPQPIIDHIRRCTHCKERIGQLEALLVRGQAVEQAPRRRTDAGLVDTLSLHFASLGESVTCAKMKSFLPALLLPSLEIQIPTPITVHLDHCRPCAEDLETIRELQLGPGQLARLSRLYAMRPEEGPETCRRTQSQIGARNCVLLDDVDVDVLDHVCVCPRCRTRIYQCRERIVTGPQGDADARSIMCGGISTADLFEIVAPYGRLAGGVKPEIASHVGACPVCMERLQSLHRTIYSVAERADSGIVTVYTCGDKTEKAVARPRGMYAGYPVDVEVTRQPQAPAPVHRLSVDRLRATFGRLSLRSASPAVKAALAAAAVIPLVAFLIISSQTASATSVRGISKAVKGVENLHVVQYGRDTTEPPAYELLIAGAAGRVGLKTAAEQALYNVKTRRTEVQYTKEGIVKDVPLEPQEYDSLLRSVDNILGFAMTGIPMDTELQRLPPEAVPNAEDDSEVYELTWPGKSLGGVEIGASYRLRVFLDPVRRLPRKTETSRQTPDDPQWRLETTMRFDYPSRQAADLAIKGMFSGQ